jgi:hypothetical protein
MLPDAREIHESEIDRRHLALTDQRQDLFRSHLVPFLSAGRRSCRPSSRPWPDSLASGKLL